MAQLTWLDLGHNALTGPIPAQLGRLTNLDGLFLQDNPLTGTIPSALGNLTSLTQLWLGFTVLTGPMPVSLSRLSALAELGLEGTGVCVPDDVAFQAWLATIPEYRPAGLTCGESVTPLTVSFDRSDRMATEGGNAPVRVQLSEAASPARAVTIAITATPGNGATAADYRAAATVTIWPGDTMGYFDFTALPDTVADDGETVTLRLGALPTGVTAGSPVAATVTIRDDDTTAESDRAALVALYNATGGPGWTDNTNWLTNSPVGEWFGVEANEHGRVTGLGLGGWDQTLRENVGNGLTGSLPLALGDLAHLRWLRISGNAGLTGPIPAELGDLANLDDLELEENELLGPIPASLGTLANLGRLALSGNRLTGALPAELGDLANLEWLHLSNNMFTGEIPAALGNLARLRALALQCWQQHCRDREGLTGPIPAELGMLVSLERLSVQDNALSGPIPSELGKPDQPGGAEPGQQPAHREDSVHAGQPDPAPAPAVVLLEPALQGQRGLVRTDPTGTGKPCQPCFYGPRQQQLERPDSARVGEPLQPGGTESQITWRTLRTSISPATH